MMPAIIAASPSVNFEAGLPNSFSDIDSTP